MNDSRLDEIRQGLGALGGLIDQLGGTVDRQHQTLTGATFLPVRQAAAETTDELLRLLTPIRRGLDELAHSIDTQEQEQNQLRALREIGAAVNSSLDLNEVLSVVMDAIVRLTRAERAILLLKNEQTACLDVTLARNMDRETIEQSASFEISRSIVRNVAATGEAVVTMNARDDPRFSEQASIINFNLRSVLCAPLKLKSAVIGVIYADNRVTTGVFGDKDRDLLTAFADQAAVAIENARLFRETRNHLAAITEMKDLLDNVLASIASGVITLDREDRVALCNRAAARIVGADPDAVLLNPLRACAALSGRLVAALVQAVKTHGETRSIEIEAAGTGDGAAVVDLTVSPLRGEFGRPSPGLAMVLNDVSEKKRLESVRRYLPPALVDRVRDLDAAQRPQRRRLSVLFADVRGFSTFSEGLEPEELIRVINGYFTVAVEAISDYEGVIDKFMGDAVMALYNTPLNSRADHAEQAVRTAWRVHERMALHHAGLPENRRLYFGIGIHTGEAIVGNVGSELRKDYSAIGDAVNLAKRIQENAAGGQILLSAETYAAVKDHVAVSPLAPMRVKGRQALEQLYELNGVDGCDVTFATGC